MNDLIDFVEAHGGALCGESRDKLVRLVQAESAARERVIERAHAEAIEQWKAAEGKLKQANARITQLEIGHDEWRSMAKQAMRDTAASEVRVEELERNIADLEQANTMVNRWIDDLQSGMYINCVYCGHRYGPNDGDHLTSMRDALRTHIEKCPKHPLSQATARVEEMRRAMDEAVDDFHKADARIEAMPCYRMWAMQEGHITTELYRPCQLNGCPRCAALRDGKGE